ncbi:hypothetical protein PINS_up011482 [Pythium insidiosum]|nr:hypothetical protein PINS_up011482 [Pythium insidiosum]
MSAILQKKPVATVSYSDVISVWSEQIGDGDTSSGTAAIKTRVLSAAICLDICQASFPLWMRETPLYVSDVQDRYRRSVDIGETINIDQFFKQTLETWIANFSKVLAQVEAVFTDGVATGSTDDAEWLDFAQFTKALAVVGLNTMTKGERLEYFEALAADDSSVNFASTDRVIQFIMHVKCSLDGRVMIC